MRPPWPLSGANRIIALATAIYALTTAWSVARILAGKTVPVFKSDTCSYLVAADQPWTRPQFYSGIHPPTVPGLWSLFSRSQDFTAIILFQTVLQGVAWVCFALTLAGLLRNRALAACCYGLVLAYSLGSEIQGYHAQLMSESISLSLLLLTVTAVIHCCRKPSWIRMAGAGALAVLLAFSRDSNAYFLLATAGVMAVREAWQAANGPRPLRIAPRLPAWALGVSFILCFAAASRNADRVVVLERDFCYGEAHPLVKNRLFGKLESRHHFALLNLFDQRILPYDFRLRHFEERGLPVNAAVRGKAFHWAFQGVDSAGRAAANWEWYWKDSLQSARSWLAREGKQAYMEYLLLHPRYTFIRPWGELWSIYTSQSPFREGFAFPILGGLGPPFRFVFGPGKPLLLAAVAAMALALLRRPGRPAEDRTLAILLAGLLPLGALFALFIYHADTMDLVRHSFTHIVTVDMLLLLSAFLLGDRLRSHPPASVLPGPRPG